MAEAVQPTPYIGQPLRRREDYKFLTGKGRYVDDINLPGMLYLAILRSPHAHARMARALNRGLEGVELAVDGFGPLRFDRAAGDDAHGNRWNWFLAGDQEQRACVIHVGVEIGKFV